jgi:hypothetical protein
MATALGQDIISDTALHLPFMACVKEESWKENAIHLELQGNGEKANYVKWRR